MGSALPVLDEQELWLNTALMMHAGPNMAGKSTIMRSTIAVALLGSCGLFGPAQAARVPYIDAFMLRTFSADAPTEGRSSFAVEMVEMRCALPPCVCNCPAQYPRDAAASCSCHKRWSCIKDLQLRHVQISMPDVRMSPNK